MHNFLGSCLVLGILAGGFAVTGDLGRLATRGMRVIQATDVPDDEAPIPVSDTAAGAGDSPAVRAESHAQAPVPRRRGPSGPDRIDLATARSGDRILLRIDSAAKDIALDVVEPASGAVILHAGPPRRAVVAGGLLVRGQPLRIVPLGLAHAGGTAAAESLGVITALDVGR